METTFGPAVDTDHRPAHGGDARFPRLLSPLRIGTMTLPNRIMMPAMHLNYHRDFGFADDTLIEFYRERARGLAGLISIGGFAVDPAGAGVFNSLLLGLWGDEYVPDLARLTRAMKQLNPTGKIACQLYHTGRVSPSSVTGLQPVAASDIPSRFNREALHVLSTDEVRALEQKYVDAAVRAVDAGFDCIDVFCGVGHLLSQFLSPATNQRTDEYGSSVANRARIAVNIVRRIRARLPGTPVLARLAGHDLMPGGNTHHEVREIAQLLEAAGADAFNVTGGWHEARVPQITGDVPTGAYAWLAQSIRTVVKVPVAASNRINDPDLAESLLRENRADFVSMGRPLLADPYLPRKLIHGEADLVSHCIACNVCLDTAWFGPTRCLVNPAAGREATMRIARADVVKRVVVVGGGPGGMSAARTAAQRGHRVILYEQHAKLGGVARIGDIAPGKLQYRWLYEDLTRQVAAQPAIEVRLNTIATAERLADDGADAIVVATGGTPIAPELPGGAATNIPIYQAHDVLDGRAGPIGNDVVIVGGGSTACETALFLKEQGSLDGETVKFLLIHRVMDPEELRQAALIGQPRRKITVVQRSARLAKDLNRSVRWTLLTALETAGVTLLANSQVRAVGAAEVTIEMQGGNLRSLPCDTIVLSTGIVSRSELAPQLRARLPAVPLFVIGDAASPRQATEAVEEGVRIGMQI